MISGGQGQIFWFLFEIDFLKGGAFNVTWDCQRYKDDIMMIYNEDDIKMCPQQTVEKLF